MKATYSANMLSGESFIFSTLTFEDVHAKHGAPWNVMRYCKDQNGVRREYSTYNPAAKQDGRLIRMMKVRLGATMQVYKLTRFTDARYWRRRKQK